MLPGKTQEYRTNATLETLFLIFSCQLFNLYWAWDGCTIYHPDRDSLQNEESALLIPPRQKDVPELS